MSRTLTPAVAIVVAGLCFVSAETQAQAAGGDALLAQSSSPGIPLAISGIFLLLGSLFFFLGKRSRRKAAEAATWPVAPATVTLSEVRVYKDRVGDDRGQKSYEPKVSYRYEVDGTAYDSGRITFGSLRSSLRGHAESVTARYPVGAPISIRHHPAKPAESTIETEAKGSLIFLIVGALLSVAGLIVGVVSFVW